MARETIADGTMRDVYEAIPHLLRLPSGRIWIDYDREADVLYLGLKRPRKATDTQYLDDQGVLLRYRGDELVGITILEASKRGGAPRRGARNRRAEA